MSDTRQHLHELVDRLPTEQLAAAQRALHDMVDDEQFDEEDRKAIAAAQEYFREGGQGVPFERVVADCGFTMDEIRDGKDAG